MLLHQKYKYIFIYIYIKRRTLTTIVKNIKQKFAEISTSYISLIALPTYTSRHASEIVHFATTSRNGQKGGRRKNRGLSKKNPRFYFPSTLGKLILKYPY